MTLVLIRVWALFWRLGSLQQIEVSWVLGKGDVCNLQVVDVKLQVYAIDIQVLKFDLFGPLKRY